MNISVYAAVLVDVTTRVTRFLTDIRVGAESLNDKCGNRGICQQYVAHQY